MLFCFHASDEFIVLGIDFSKWWILHFERNCSFISLLPSCLLQSLGLQPLILSHFLPVLRFLYYFPPKLKASAASRIISTLYLKSLCDLTNAEILICNPFRWFSLLNGSENSPYWYFIDVCRVCCLRQILICDNIMFDMHSKTSHLFE